VRLSKLEMIGFKSFMNKVELSFEDGITAVLGPNGCGKSNIVDAIRWVLGEQSAKLLRGAKMENVIFEGTKQRAPMGFAEVTLTFTGASERLPVEWDEISIKRRVTRAGGSEYFLNNQPYRLHEIRDLLSGTGLGNHVYSIIELGMVKDILSEAGEKRRLMFEEASGIIRYKTRRKESLSKLASTDADLTRLDDILDELGKSVRSLKYQVGRARSYQRIQTELSKAELQYASEQLHAYWREERELRTDQDNLGDSSRASEGELTGVEAELTELQVDLLTREEDYTRRRNVLEEETAVYRKREEELAVLDERIRSEERQVAHLSQETRMAAEAISRLETERGELETERVELETLGAELETSLIEADERHAAAAARFGERRDLLQREKQLQLNFARTRAEAGGEVERLNERIEAGVRRREELREEAARLDEQLAELGGRLAVQRESEAAAAAALLVLQNKRSDTIERRERAESGREEVDELLRDLELRRESAAARLELLERLREEGAGYPEGARRLLESQGENPALLGVLADRLQVADEHRLAVECVLERLLGALVLREGAQGISWLHELKAAGSGRALLLELSSGAATVRPESLPGLTPLMDCLDCEEELRAPLSRLLSRHYLAPDAEDARVALARQGGEDLILVTPDGFIFQSGLTTGGSAGAEEGQPLGRGREIESLGAELEKLEPERIRLDRARRDHLESLAALRSELEEIDADLALARRELSDRETERARLETLHTRNEEESEGVIAEREYQERQATAMSEALVAAEQGLEELGEERPAEELDLPALETEVARLEREREAARAHLDEKRLERTAVQGRRENLTLRAENLERGLAGQWARRRNSEEGAETARAAVTEHGGRSRELRDGLGAERSGLDERREEADARLAELNVERERQTMLQSRTRELRAAQRESEQAGHDLEIRRNTLRVKMEDLQTRVKEELAVELDPAVDPALALERGDEEQSYRPPEGKTLAEAVEELRDKLGRIGVVNLLALEEFEEKDERYQFLLTQKEDLLTARGQLMETIDRINQEARQRFSESFKVIRKNFVEIFLTLFDGGEADLSYTMSEKDPLHADIVVTAKPKDKNISSVQLLSSGEKTLTALSLLFAVYLSRPSPFCVFDEVDAPLDDANIARFTKLVREFTNRTQFVIITHNKLTMEVASHLYGVTMQESGVSKLVSVAFDDVPDDLDAGQAQARSAS
jgi:chromosome segregation protein